MVISHNMLALNANRQLNIITNQKNKNTEKLSSGYRINRAADDAAGLSISEKMRRQIRGLSQGVKNTQDGVSLCQVADGALAEVSEMLHRITELSVKSANGTNTAEDRKAIQQEIKQILKEIDRIGDTTTFNERKIFVDGAQGIDGSNINSGNNVIIGYRPEIITSTVPVQKSDSFVFNISGESTELVGQTYTVSSAITSDSGLIIGTDTISWSSVTDENGFTVDLNNDISAGTYSFDYKGITVSFDVTRDVTAEQFVKGLKGLSWTTKKGNNSQINYSLTATTTADYSNNKKTYKVQATNDGIIVNDVLYSWPDSVKNGALEGNSFDINAGDVQFKLSVGSDNTASLSDIIQNIGTKTINETTRTSYTTPISQMSISRSDADTDVKTSNEMIDIMRNTSCIKTDTDGCGLKLEQSKVTVPSVGTVLKDTKTNSKYVVTSKKSKTVQYSGAIKKNTSTVSIPATVKIDGVTYKVTSIQTNAFRNNKKIKKIIIGSNIKKIGKNAFYGCKNLKSITIRSTKLTEKMVGGNAFKGIDRKAVIKVPKEKYKIYQKLLKSRGFKGKIKAVSLK